MPRVLAAALLGCLAATAMATPGARVVPGNRNSHQASITPDGRFVVFTSSASNLVARDTNRTNDIFVYTRATRTLERVNVSAGGRQANGNSYLPVISANGRFVAFVSCATNLVVGDTNDMCDVFVRDRKLGRTGRVSVGVGGAQAKDSSSPGGLSADGRYVVFESEAANLVRGDTNVATDVFVRDRVAHRTERISVSSGGQGADDESTFPTISADGRFVAFMSYASNLVAGGHAAIYLRDRWAHRTTLLVAGTSSSDTGTVIWGGSLSADARVLVYDTSAVVSTDTGEHVTNGDIIGILDRITRRIETIRGGDEPGYAGQGTPSPDGRYVTFLARPAGVRTGAAVYVRDRSKKLDEAESVDAAGRTLSGDCESGSVTRNGRFVVFSCNVSTLVPGDTNRWSDVFVRDRVTGTTTLVSAAGTN